jgi:hypothetical protein
MFNQICMFSGLFACCFCLDEELRQVYRWCLLLIEYPSVVRDFFFCLVTLNVNEWIVLIRYDQRITRFVKVWSLLEFMSLSGYESSLIEGTCMLSHVGKLKTSNKNNKANLLKSLTAISSLLLGSYCRRKIRF